MKKVSVLNQVRDFLTKRGDQFDWLTLPDGTKGLAYVLFDVSIPCSFLCTETKEPLTLMVDLVLATKVSESNRVEMGVLLNHLNLDQTSGYFQLDPLTGYVYYRQSFILEGLNLTKEQLHALINNMETYATSKVALYAEMIESAL